MRAAYAITDKQERTTAVARTRDAIKAALSEEQLADANLGSALKKLESAVLRGDVVKHWQAYRRSRTDEIRDIVAETGILPRTHGSALFTRGETQGSGRYHAWYRRRRADDRRAARHVSIQLHAAL